MGFGGRLAVVGAVGIAEALDVPEVIIGLTLVSFGMTLPELATCLMAARRGQSDIVLGNIVGSNIINLLFIGGLCAIIRPIPVPDGGHLDLVVAAVLSLSLLPISFTGGRRITRLEGGVLLGGYLAYMTWRVLTQGAVTV